MQNIDQYGPIPLSVVQRIATYIYQSRTYLDEKDKVIIIHREGKKTFPWKPLTNPRHIVDIIHKLLEDSKISLGRDTEGAYRFSIKKFNKFHYAVDYTGKTIWEAAARLVLDQLNQGEG